MQSDVLLPFPWLTLAVFVLVYLGMIFGRLPKLLLDRTGVALLGALVLMASGDIGLERATRAIDLPTVALLFGLMVLSAQLRLAGFYGRVAFALAETRLSPRGFLGAILFLGGALSAVFTNDVVCVAIAPVLIAAARQRKEDPIPLLLALAAGANIGSAATLIGNPQNILVGQSLGLSFRGYLWQAWVPALLGLLVTWWILARQIQGGRASTERPMPHRPPEISHAQLAETLEATPPFDRWQTTKGLLIAGVIVVLFLFSDWPRELVALGGAGVIMLSRRLHSKDMLGLVDWQLLVLFIGLFIVNGAFQASGFMEQIVTWSAHAGMDLAHPASLFLATVLLSNVVSNVPAVMLLLPASTHPMGGPILALASTLAGNLLIVGSIANIIVVEAAAQHGIRIDWRRHARVGVPVTLATLAVAAMWLFLLSQ